MDRLATARSSVIVVERDPDLRGVLVDLVGAEGLAVLGVEDAEQAQQAAGDPGWSMVVIVDSWGCEDYPRQLARFGGSVVVIAESNASFERAARLGLLALRKPFNLDDFERALSAALARSKTRRAKHDQR